MAAGHPLPHRRRRDPEPGGAGPAGRHRQLALPPAGPAPRRGDGGVGDGRQHGRAARQPPHPRHDGHRPRETVTGIQLFGADPDAMAHAAVVAQEAGARMVDINMGCPVHKVCKTGAGSSLLGDLPRAEAIVSAMARAVSIPVTVKMRRGLTPSEARPVEAARRFEAAGAAAIAFHPRAAEEEYRGVADHAITADVVAAVSIPVMASGDITTARRAREVFERTGCAAVMIGRAALGDPWVFGAMATGRPSLRPGLPGVVDEIEAFAADARAVLGDRRAVHFMRKFYPWYLTGEDVPQQEVAALLVMEDLDEALGRLRHLAGSAPLASARGLN
ncbi:MAG: tRNA-dihydrouridine synthase [Thermoleophilia bacterium]